MFKYEFNSNSKLGVLVGLYNVEPAFFQSIKKALEELYINNINYIQIKSENLKLQIIKRRKEKSYDELGMISLNWVEKIKEYLPGVIIRMMDIDELINNSPLDINKVDETAVRDILRIKNIYLSSNQVIIIKNFKKLYNLEDSIKSQVASRNKYLGEKCIIFINDQNYKNNLEIIKKIANIIKTEISNFYTSKIKFYRNKYKNNENINQKEYAIKYLIKTFLFSYFSNTINIDNTINYYDYIAKAYNILSTQLNKKSYIFCQPNIKIIYLELKNISDFLIFQLLSQNDITLNNIINLIIRHLANFDFINFNKDKNLDIKIIANACKRMKDIYFINLAWKHSWYEYLLENYKKIDLVDINYISLKGYMMNNLFHLYYFLLKEPNFIQEINSTINTELNYKKIQNHVYIEKIPKYYEINGQDIVGKLSDEENLSLYIHNIIFENKKLLNPKNVINILENLIFNSKTNYYDLFLINKYCLENNEIDEEIDKILGKLLQKNNKYLIKFPKVYSYLSIELNKYILKNKIEENNEEKTYNKFKMIEYLILYASISKKDLISEEINKINELISYNFEQNNNIIKINSFENQLFKIEASYNVKEVNPLDYITTNIKISLLRNDITMGVDKIIVYFPKRNINQNENNYKEIIFNKELSINNSIEFHFNILVNFFFNNLYIIGIELYLKNKLVISLTNKEKRNIVLKDKNSDLLNENDIIDLKLITSKKEKKIKNNNNPENILIGKNENHLFSLIYNTILNNNDIYIKNTKAIFQLMKEQSKKDIEPNSFQFKTLDENGYNNCTSKELNLQYNNINYEQNPPPLQFVLQMKELGEYNIKYNIFFTLVNRNCPDDHYILKLNGNIGIQCLESFIYSKKVNSSLYYINQRNKNKSYPIDYPINIISTFENELSENIVIKKIIYTPLNDSIIINSPIEKLFMKKNNYKISFVSKEKISFHSKIISKEDINGSIGQIKILWISENLFNHKNYNDSMLNESTFSLSSLFISKLPIIIQGRYIKQFNKYQFKIKNLESISKIIKFSLKEKKENNKQENFILCGKTDINRILLPLKEFNIQYNIYDKETGSSFIEINKNITYKFNNIIILNEYFISESKDRFDENSLRNIIYYTPEFFKLTN